MLLNIFLNRSEYVKHTLLTEVYLPLCDAYFNRHVENGFFNLSYLGAPFKTMYFPSRRSYSYTVCLPE